MTVRLLVPAYGKQTNALYTGTTVAERALIDAGQADNNLSASFDYAAYLDGKSIASIVPGLSAPVIDAAGGLTAQSAGTLAQRLLRSAQRGITPIRTVLASSPTYSEGANGANSTINPGSSTGLRGGLYQPDNSSRVTPLGGPIIVDPNNGARFRQQTRIATYSNLARTGGHGSGIRFATQAQAFDIAINFIANGDKLALYVTDPTTGIRARGQAADYTQTNTGMAYRKWDFGSRALRIIELYWGPNTSCASLNVASTETIYAVPDSDQLKTLVLSDSWFDGGGINNTGLPNPIKLNSCDFLGERLGVGNIYSAAVSGTGVVAGDQNATSGSFIQRVQAGDIDSLRIGLMDAIYVNVSGNDASATDADVQAGYATLIQLVRTAQPKALIFGAGPQNITTRVPTQSRFNAARDGFAAGAGGDPRCIYLDNSYTGENWIPTPMVTNVNMGPDGDHPNELFAQYYGWRIADSMIAATKLRFGL